MIYQEDVNSMYETVFLTILLASQTVLIRSGVDSMFTSNEVPKKTIQECAIHTGIDPFNQEQMSNFYNELTYMDCVYHDLGDHEHNIYQ